MILGQFFVNVYAQEGDSTSTDCKVQSTCPSPSPPSSQYAEENDASISTQNEVIFSQKVYPVSAIDPTILTNTAGSFYPGLRGAGQMIIYTPAFGLRTNTNEFGTEAIVDGNIVTSLSGADSIIPLDGLVISGHGSAKQWMNKNIITGAKVYVNKDSKTLTIYITSDSFIYSAKAKIKEAQDIINYYKNLSPTYDCKKPCMYLQNAQEYLDKAERHPREVQRYSSLAIESANQALAHSIPYQKDELKGVWIRPSETTTHAIIETLDKIHAAGIDNIFLETYFHGETIFPSKTMANYQFQSQNEKFLGFDPLKVWIEEAHKRGIKVNIWFETFYVGNDNPKDNSKSILAVDPDWGNKPKRDFDSLLPVPSLSEHCGYFLDPANPDVQEFLEELLTEIIQNYHPDGINLDYIRYPQSIAAKFAGYDLSNWGYTEYARDEFKKTYGKDPIDIDYGTPEWLLWDKYRQDKITSFVLRISKLTKQNKILLTTVIFPDRQKALETKQQDWRTWSSLGYVDGFTPLLLTCDAKTANVMLQDVIKNKNRNTALYAGLFITFMDGSSEDLLRQIQETRKLGTKGVIMFDYAHLNDKYINTLTKSVFDASQALPQSNQGNTLEPQTHRRFFFKSFKNLRG